MSGRFDSESIPHTPLPVSQFAPLTIHRLSNAAADCAEITFRIAKLSTTSSRVLQAPLIMSGLFQSSGEMLSHTNRIGHCGKRGVHRPDADEEAGVDHIQIVELMR